MTTDFISFIPLDSAVSELFEFENSLEGLSSLRQINCFIGANNSGKSRLIRELFKTLHNGYDSNLSESKFDFISTIADFINISEITEFTDAASYLLDKLDCEGKVHNHALWFYANQLIENVEAVKESAEEIFHINNHAQFRNVLHVKNNTALRSSINNIYNNGTLLHSKPIYVKHFLRDLERESVNLYNFIKNKIKKDLDIPKLYIPILRGMRTLDPYSSDFYAQRTEKDYAITKENMFSGLSIYNDIKKHLLGSSEKRKLIREFEEFLSESFFDGKTINLIPNIESDVVYVKEGEDEKKEYPIFQLGDGVQALIILTFPLFLRKNEEWAIFIEEPEAHLHPKWQRFFINTINKYFQKHQFFFTTHSNVLLNYKDCSVYHVAQDNSSNITTIRHIDTQYSEVLDELGYKASDLLNANYILWVEGVSDKIYFTQFIKAYDSGLIEGVDYTIMMYGGCAQLDHLAVEDETSYKIQIESMNKNFGFCIDSDNLVGKGFKLAENKKNFQDACSRVNKFCWITEVRETENLIPVDIWRLASVDYAKSIKIYEKDSISDADVDLTADGIKTYDEKHSDRMKTKVNIITKKSSVIVNNKIKMAQQVVKIFPQDENDLKKNPELYDNIKKLVAEIKKANEL